MIRIWKKYDESDPPLVISLENLKIIFLSINSIPPSASNLVRVPFKNLINFSRFNPKNYFYVIHHKLSDIIRNHKVQWLKTHVALIQQKRDKTCAGNWRAGSKR